MQQFWLRVLLAALFSLAGAMATHFWARALRDKDPVRAESEVAFVASSTNEVMKRPAQRQIWRTAYPNEPIYFDEAIRTAGDAEAKIRFNDGTVIELDGDSVIEIRKEDDGINLGFLKGSLFIRAGEGPSTLTVQSGEEKIAVAKSELAVTKSAPTGPMEIEVVKGEMKVLKKDQNAKPFRRLKITHPTIDEVVYLKPDSGERAAIEWEPIDPSYQVYVEVGETPQDLKRDESAPPQRGSIGRLQAPLKVGKNYVRLIAKSTLPEMPELKSAVRQARVMAKLPPVLLSPEMESVHVPPKTDPKIVFTWSNPGDLLDQRLEVSRSSNLKNPIFSDTVGDKVSIAVAVGSEPGNVYWRVSGRIPATGQMISSPVWNFFANEKPLEPLLAPVLKTPASAQKIAYSDMKAHGVSFLWSWVKGADRYEVVLTELPPGEKGEPKSFKREMTSNNIKIENLQPGAYTWTVVARDAKGRESPASETRKFTIEGVPVLAWSDNLTSVKFTYRTPKPFLKAAWARGPGAPNVWRVRLFTDREPAAEAEWKIVQKPEFETPVPADGLYKLEAEALDADGKVLARTQVRTMDVAQIPLPEAPEFIPETPPVIQAGSDGHVDFEWLPVKEARQYVIEIRDGEGKPVESQKLPGRKYGLRLKTGDYKVVLKAIDSYGRTGPESPPRPLKVPEYSDVRAPKIKNATVK